MVVSKLLVRTFVSGQRYRNLNTMHTDERTNERKGSEFEQVHHPFGGGGGWSYRPHVSSRFAATSML